MKLIEKEKTYFTYRDGTVAEVREFEFDMRAANEQRKMKDECLEFLFRGLDVNIFNPNDAFDLYADWQDDYSGHPIYDYFINNVDAYDVMFYIERKRGLVK